MTDHGISIVTQKDCALLRVVQGDEICSSYNGNRAIAVAATDTDAGDELAPLDVGSEDAPDTAEVETDFETINIAIFNSEKVHPESKDAERLLIIGARTWSDSINADTYYVIGSFSNRDNAHSLISKHSDLGPAVMVSLRDGDKVYRVAVGPFHIKQKRDMRHSLKKSDITNAWAMQIDHQKWKIASPREFFNTGKSIAQAPAISKPTIKAKPV